MSYFDSYFNRDFGVDINHVIMSFTHKTVYNINKFFLDRNFVYGVS